MGFIRGVNPKIERWVIRWLGRRSKNGITPAFTVIAVAVGLGLVPHHTPRVDHTIIVSAEDAAAFELAERFANERRWRADQHRQLFERRRQTGDEQEAVALGLVHEAE